jgi:O-antigen/teichoic acid export membrane protein
MGILSPILFPFIFGPSWIRAGYLVSWMTPWFIFQFLASPISMTLHVIGEQKAALGLQIFSLATRLGAVWLALEIDPRFAVESYALSGAIVYASYLAVTHHYLRKATPELPTPNARIPVKIIATWTGISLAIAISILLIRT